MAENVHIANATSNDIYVMASESLGWNLADLFVDTFLLGLHIDALLEVGAGGIVLPETIITLDDLKKFLKFSISVLALGTFMPDRTVDLAEDVVNLFMKNSRKIPPGQCANVCERGFLSYLTASGFASLLNAEIITLIILSVGDDGKKMAHFSTSADYSWIANNNEVVRAKYGHLSTEDRNNGFYRFSKGDRLFANESFKKSTIIDLSESFDGDSFLLPGECISSSNGDYDFVYQLDGNAVVYRRNKPSGENPESASMTNGHSTGAVRLQYGNIVIFDKNDNPISESKSAGTGYDFKNSRLVMQDDGNLVVYTKSGKPIWASKTCGWFPVAETYKKTLRHHHP